MAQFSETINQRYFYLEKAEILGEFTLNKQSNNVNSIITPVLKVEINESKNDPTTVFKLVPGVLELGAGFYKCPLAINYVKLISVCISCFKNPYLNDITELELEIFNKTFEQSLHKHLQFKDKDTRIYNYIFISKAINLINQYIQLGKDITKFNYNKLKLDFYLKDDFSNSIIEQIESMKMTFYENDIYRGPGKDIEFWQEVEVENLPTNEYVKCLIVEALEKIVENIIVKDYGLLLQFGFDYMAGAYKGRSIGFKDEKMERKLKSSMIYYCAQQFEPPKYISGEFEY